jgi:hypothetical protein
MRDELDRALDKNPDYPPGFDLRVLEDAVGEDEIDLETASFEDLE